MTVALLVLSIALYFVFPIVSIPLMVISFMPLFHYQGVEINPKNSTYRNYVSFVGIRSGKWKSLSPFKAVVMITTKGKKRAHHMTSERNANTTGLIHKVYLADQSHRKRLLILRTEDEEKGKQAIAALKSKLNLPYETYNPTFSEKTMKRRAQRMRK